MTHSDIEKDNQAGMGITPAMVRISVGVEHPEDIIEDIKLALGVV
jgi:methionine-gamma-lyase